MPASPAAQAFPELVVDAPKQKKKAARSKAVDQATATTAVVESEEASDDVATSGVSFGGTPSDTGTTTFDASNVKVRSNGGGDANSFLRNLPNVQYQNEADGSPGVTAQDIIDTKPLLLSISGARTYENNIIVNGVSVNNITGAVDGGATLGSSTQNPVTSQMYGLHPQTVFVPTEFVGEATVIDSNASAEYGSFQGGVVIYDLAQPPTDRYRASINYSHHTSDWVNYILATEDGTNPGNRKAPKFEKDNLAVSLGAPITKDFSFIVQASRKEAETSTQQVYYISDDYVTEDSENVFLRFAATARTDIGNFKLDTSLTDYFQHWENIYGRDLYIDTEIKSSSTQLEYTTDLTSIRSDDLGLGRVKLKARAYYNDSETLNSSGDNVMMTWLKQQFRWTAGSYVPVYDTTLHDDWCRGVDPATYTGTDGIFVSCREGGYGNQLQSQTDFGAQANLTGDLLLGGFKAGTEIKQVEGRRARLEELYDARGGYSNVYAQSIPGFAGFDCQGALMCDSEQYAASYFLTPQYDISKTLNAVHAYAEIDQTWQWFNLRAGVRLDYDDYMENVNLAPRLAATISPFRGISITGGYNRYYEGETLYYALRDGQPASVTYRRTHNPDGTINEATPAAAASSYSYRVSSLDTPYNDEFTGAVTIADPVLGGQWRFKYLERYGEDQFATESCGTATIPCYEATNGGERFYRSATAEYTKIWNRLDTPYYLNAAAITGSVTWSEQSTSRNSYLSGVDEDLNGDGIPDYPIWYNGQSYLPSQFGEVTGNLDIPVRFGATLSTVWFNDVLELNVSAGVNLGFDGVYYTGRAYWLQEGGNWIRHNEYADKKFDATLKLDVSGRINISEHAAIDFSVENITNSDENLVTTSANPWLMGRSYWVGSAVKF